MVRRSRARRSQWRRRSGGLRFSLRDAYDFMPRIRINTSGDPKASVNVSWQSINAAQGVFLSAMGARGEKEMIV